MRPSEPRKMRNYTCWFHPLLNSGGDRLQLKRLWQVKCCKPLPRLLSISRKPLRLVGNLVVSFGVTPGPASCRDSSQLKKKKMISFSARMWSVLLLSGDRRLLREKRVGRRFCKEMKADKNGLVCLANTKAPSTRLHHYWSQERNEGQN